MEVPDSAGILSDQQFHRRTYSSTDYDTSDLIFIHFPLRHLSKASWKSEDPSVLHICSHQRRERIYGHCWDPDHNPAPNSSTKQGPLITLQLQDGDIWPHSIPAGIASVTARHTPSPQARVFLPTCSCQKQNPPSHQTPRFPEPLFWS